MEYLVVAVEGFCSVPCCTADMNETQLCDVVCAHAVAQLRIIARAFLWTLVVSQVRLTQMDPISIYCWNLT